jgi:hypothetical protein
MRTLHAIDTCLTALSQLVYEAGDLDRVIIDAAIKLHSVLCRARASLAGIVKNE